MNFIKSKINRIAVCGAIVTAGLIFLIMGISNAVEYANSSDAYKDSYTTFLSNDTPIKGDIWCVEGIFAESDSYTYMLIPITDEETFISQQDMKFIVYCCKNSKRENVQELIDYWNDELDYTPDDLRFNGIISKASDEIQEGAYAYFEQTYGFDKEQADGYFLPYVITDVNSFAYAYMPKIIVGFVFALVGVLFYIMLEKKEKSDENKVFTEDDVPKDDVVTEKTPND